MLEKTLESPLDCKEVQPVLKEISPEDPLEGLVLKLTLQYFGLLMQRADSVEKDPDAGRDWGQEEKGTTEDEMAGWHHRLMSIESVMPTNHLILCRPLLLLPSVFPSITVFANESTFHIRCP